MISLDLVYLVMIICILQFFSFIIVLKNETCIWNLMTNLLFTQKNKVIVIKNFKGSVNYDILRNMMINS